MGIKTAILIPARMASTRFPGKPLIPILGLPMIEHVRRRALKTPGVSEVVVTTCDDEIRKKVEGFGGKVIMTSIHHQGATDRIAEAARSINADVMVNLQGDEPMIIPRALSDLIRPFQEKDGTLCTNLVYPIHEEEELISQNVVKTALSKSSKLLYLSRSVIPGKEFQKGFSYYKQGGIIAFEEEFLQKYASWKRTPIEIKESIDVMRILENDYSIDGVLCNDETVGVDIPEQAKTVERAILSSPIQKALHESIL